MTQATGVVEQALSSVTIAALKQLNDSSRMAVSHTAAAQHLQLYCCKSTTLPRAEHNISIKSNPQKHVRKGPMPNNTRVNLQQCRYSTAVMLPAGQPLAVERQSAKAVSHCRQQQQLVALLLPADSWLLEKWIDLHAPKLSLQSCTINVQLVLCVTAVDTQ
jgi:hypothetical protein